MEEQQYDLKDYDLKDFVRDNRFLEAAHNNLDYSPDSQRFWNEEETSIMGDIIKIFYKRLYGPEGKLIPVDDCDDGRIRMAFRNIYCQKAMDIDKFRKRVLESLGQDWKNYLLAREIARIDHDRDLEYMCDERIGTVLDSMGPKEIEEALRHIWDVENHYRLMHAKP